MMSSAARLTIDGGRHKTTWKCRSSRIPLQKRCGGERVRTDRDSAGQHGAEIYTSDLESRRRSGE